MIELQVEDPAWAGAVPDVEAVVLRAAAAVLAFNLAKSYLVFICFSVHGL